MSRPVGRLRRRRPHEREQFTVPLNQHTGPPPPPDVLPWYWDPQREGVKPPPAAFARQLREIDPDLRVCFNPVLERWVLWFKNPRIGTEPGFPAFLRPGWQLLMIWEHPISHDYLPLTELLFHNIYVISRGRIGGAKQYYDRIQANIEREKAERDATYQNDRQAQQADFRSSLQISSAGRGNRFALHHDGGLVASPGEQAWRRETRKTRLGAEHLKQEANEAERKFYGP